jgi:hypothetical protein
MTEETNKTVFALEIIFDTLEIMCLNFCGFLNITSIKSDENFGNMFI